MRVCFSGTFNVLHKGHKYLIEKAFQNAGTNGKVFIGVTDDSLLKDKKYKIPLKQRIENLRLYLDSKGYLDRVEIKVIKDKYYLAVIGEYDAMITSPETRENAELINKKRIQQNKKPLEIIEVPYILDEDDKKISSTRILDKKIDEEGKMIE